MPYNRIVLNEPHASMEGLYDDRLSGWSIDDRFINHAVLRLTDWHTDYLFHGFRHPKIRTVRFPYSRFIVDAERLWNDPMERIGQGIIYRHFDGYRRKVSPTNEAHLLQLWRNHQQQLKRNLCKDALLLDCHSFPEEQGDVDICIGFNEDWSKPDKELIDFTANLFEDHGYTVGINYPYSNSEAPPCPFPYQSMMLEVNKRVYLERQSLYLKTRCDRKRSVREVVSLLLETVSGPLSTHS